MKASDNPFPKVILNEAATDGSDFSNPSADYRVLFLGEDGALHLKDSSGTVTDIGGGALTDHTHAATGSGADGGGATLAPTSLTGSGKVAFSGTIDSSVNADQNDFAPTGIHTKSIIRFTSFSAGRSITGIDAGETGEVLFLINNTSYTLSLPNESTSSAAANRFRCPNASTVSVRQQGSVLLLYVAGRWCVIAI